MHPPRLLLVTVTALTLTSCAGSEEKRRLTEVLEAARSESGTPGAIVAVKPVGEPPIVVAVGHTDLTRSHDLAPDHPFFLGSISKTYTAVAAMRLVEEGTLALGDPLSRWLPSFPRAGDITIRQLLDHSSGLRDFYSYIYARPDRDEMVELVTKPWSQDELLELAGRFGHWFEPGSDWAYSSTNYYLLGVVIERATGASLSEAYRVFIHEPLGLDGTWLAWHEPPLGNLPVGHMGPVAGWDHSTMFGELGATTMLDRSPVEWGAGGLVSPADEALLFLEAVLAGDLLEPRTSQTMTDFSPTPPIGLPGSAGGAVESDNGYGLGLVRMVRDGVTFIGHGGLFTGHTAGLWFVPECRIGVALYFNRGFVGQRDLLDQVVEAWTPCRGQR